MCIRAIRVILLRLVLQLIFAECRVLCFQFIEQAPGSPKAPSASFVQQAIRDISTPENFSDLAEPDLVQARRVYDG